MRTTINLDEHHRPRECEEAGAAGWNRSPTQSSSPAEIVVILVDTSVWADHFHQHVALLETLLLIENRKLMGKGLGYIDVHLLASTTLDVDVQLWTRDRLLRVVAADLRLAAALP